VVFLQGGGSLQFLMTAMNFSKVGDKIDYVHTGYWSKKAIKSAQSLDRDVAIVASSENEQYYRIPYEKVVTRDEAKYLHICTNNTVVGTQWHQYPEVAIPIVADMSSDFLSKTIDTIPFGCIYAHAQKNTGLSGITIVLIRKSMLENMPDNIPEMLDYRSHIKNKSNYHTPACFSMYVTWLMLQWLEDDIGGVEAMAEINQRKAKMLYEYLDTSSFFQCPVVKDSRSLMNVIFSTPNSTLDQLFIAEAANNSLIGVAGHRSQGGCRVSLYNSVTEIAVEHLVSFMQKFEENNI
jgi:phosphoserine aminotransferase